MTGTTSGWRGIGAVEDKVKAGSGVAAGQRLLPIEWHLLAERFRRADGARESPWNRF
ncbi:hypothetical protein KQ305_09905 [Synechococcus sp. CS-1332]|nr:hypothetical protein [Synechococcus sp. CS-1332]